MKFPTDNELDAAVAWLRQTPACAAVADWLEAKADAEMLRTEARRAGLSVRAVRQRLEGAVQ